MYHFRIFDDSINADTKVKMAQKNVSSIELEDQTEDSEDTNNLKKERNVFGCIMSIWIKHLLKLINFFKFLMVIFFVRGILSDFVDQWQAGG